jgi:hypothetical protein
MRGYPPCGIDQRASIPLANNAQKLVQRVKTVNCNHLVCKIRELSFSFLEQAAYICTHVFPRVSEVSLKLRASFTFFLSPSLIYGFQLFFRKPRSGCRSRFLLLADIK